MKAFLRHISEFFPEKKYSNDDFFKEFPDLLEKKETLLKVGIENRFIVDRNETASDLCFGAASKLLSETKISTDEIDFIIFCSTEFDHYTPTTSALLQSRLNLSNSVGAIDLVSSCTGFIHSLSVAKGLLETNSYRNILVLCVSTLTKTFHLKDSNSKFLFGDAATAILISGHSEESIGQFVFGTDGSRGDYIIVKDGGGRNPLTEKSFEEELNEYGNITSKSNFCMNGTGIFLFGIKTVPVLVNDILKKNNMLFDEIDYFVFHQANRFLLETLQKKMGIPDEKFIYAMENTGNTVAATIPLALNHLFKNNPNLKGKKILLAAFGTGLTWGGTILKT